MTDTQHYELVPFERPEDGIYGYVDGVPVTDDVLAWAIQDAEDGFPDSIGRPIGRPRHIDQDEPAVAIRFRVSPRKLRALDEKAHARNTSRAALLRSAVDRELAAT